MPKGPQGQKRPADVIGNAVHIMRIATGEEEEHSSSQMAIERGVKGGIARARKLTATKRKKIAREAAIARWNRSAK